MYIKAGARESHLLGPVVHYLKHSVLEGLPPGAECRCYGGRTHWNRKHRNSNHLERSLPGWINFVSVKAKHAQHKTSSDRMCQLSAQVLTEKHSLNKLHMSR